MGELIRYVHGENRFTKFKADMAFLVNKVVKSKGELDLQLRNNRFNIYYKGNSLASVELLKTNYKVTVNSAFNLNEAVEEDKKKRFVSRVKSIYASKEKKQKRKPSGHIIRLESGELEKFFQESIVKFLQQQIKKRGYGEEITFEQSLITDNLGRKTFFFIDRQVTGGGLSGTLDLLGLKRQVSGKYSFIVLEVKLGNNHELSGDVAGQLQRYKKAISKNIAAFKTCYEKNYMQKRSLGLFPDNFPENISIDNRVEGKIVVGFYSQLGKDKIRELEKLPNMKGNIISFWNELKNV